MPSCPVGPGGRLRGGTGLVVSPSAGTWGAVSRLGPAGAAGRRGRGCPVWSWDRHWCAGRRGFSVVPRTRAPGAGPTHCKEGLFGVEPFAQDPGWGQERPGWVCAGTGGSLGFLAVSPTSPIPCSPTRVATPRADAGPKPQRLKVRGQAGLCTCLYLTKALRTPSCVSRLSPALGTLPDSFTARPGRVPSSSRRTEWDVRRWGGSVGTRACDTWPVPLAYVLGPAGSCPQCCPPWSPAFILAGGFQDTGLGPAPRPHDYHSPPPPVSPGGELTS